MFCGVMRPLNIGKRYLKVESVGGRMQSFNKVEKP